MKPLLPFVVILVAAACSDRAAPLAPTAEYAASMTSKTAAAKAEKVDVCHINGTGNYQLLNINGNALPAHVRHGDVLPGEGGLGVDCKAAAVVFSFVSAGAVDGYIVWTVDGTTSAVSYDIQSFTAAPPGSPAPGTWTTEETVVGTGTGSYQSAKFYLSGTYRVLATVSGGPVVATPDIVF